MNKLLFTGRLFYASALFVYGIQQLYFGTFRDVFFSPYQQHLPALKIFAYIFGVYLLITSVMIVIHKKGRRAALLLGFIFMILFLGTHITYELISEPNKLYHLGIWTAPLKELALAGGAFVVAQSFGPVANAKPRFAERFAQYGNLFFFFTIISFGIAHIIYVEFVESTVPGWMANPGFWVTLTGITLIAAGVAIILGLRIQVIALLLSLEIFLWFWLVHVPGTLSHPLSDNRGNLLASAFDALAFSGTALLVALTMKQQQWVEDVERALSQSPRY